MVNLAELAEFYGVPTEALLPDPPTAPPGSFSPTLVVNLQRLTEVPAHLGGPLARYAAAIQSQRADHDAEILTIRTEDLHSLSVIYDLTPEDMVHRFQEWGVLPGGTELISPKKVLGTSTPCH